MSTKRRFSRKENFSKPSSSFSLLDFIQHILFKVASLCCNLQLFLVAHASYSEAMTEVSLISVRESFK